MGIEMKKHYLLGMILMWMGVATAIQAQQQPPPQQQGDSGVIQIEEQRLDTRLELPQIQILDKRKQIRFEEVKVEKSFQTEISGKNEKLQFKPNSSGKVRTIKNIPALVNKPRF